MKLLGVFTLFKCEYEKKTQTLTNEMVMIDIGDWQICMRNVKKVTKCEIGGRAFVQTTYIDTQKKTENINQKSIRRKR